MSDERFREFVEGLGISYFPLKDERFTLAFLISVSDLELESAFLRIKDPQERERFVRAIVELRSKVFDALRCNDLKPLIELLQMSEELCEKLRDLKTNVLSLHQEEWRKTLQGWNAKFCDECAFVNAMSAAKERMVKDDAATNTSKIFEETIMNAINFFA